MIDLITRIEQPHDAHVQEAHQQFRSCGFTLAAMQFPRCAEALSAIKRFNGLADTAKVPFAWNYHPNQWCRDNWRDNFATILRAERNEPWRLK